MAKTVLKITMNTNVKTGSNKVSKARKIKRPSRGRGGNIGVSAEKRRAMLAFCIKYNIVLAGCKTLNVVSMNRVMYVVGTSKRALNEFLKISKML